MKNKKLLITILMFSILLTIIVVPISASASETTITNLTNTTWYVPSGWTTSLMQLELGLTPNAWLVINGTDATGLALGCSVDNSDFPTQIGKANYIATSSNAGLWLNSYANSTALTIEFLNEEYAISSGYYTNSELISWLETYGELQSGGTNTPSLSPSPTYGYKDYGILNITDIDSVWTDKETYKVAIVFADHSSNLNYTNVHLVIGSFFYKDYIHNETSISGSPQTYCSISNWQWYDYNIETEQWDFNTSGTNNIICRTENYALMWASDTLYKDSTRTEPFFHLTPTLTEVVEGTKVMEELLMVLPIVIPCLVGYAALRKALAILVQILHKA